jgi:aminopeptidase N
MISQSSGIRQIFPCADEPGLKATFAATMIADQGLTCLSNMDIASEEVNNVGKKTVVFNKTPPMSSYLFYFVVGELNYIESNEFRVPVRIYATPDQDIKGGKFALDVSAQAMMMHEKTFGSPYPLPKLDSIAVPGHSGGMETGVVFSTRTDNWFEVSLTWQRLTIRSVKVLMQTFHILDVWLVDALETSSYNSQFLHH